MKVEKIEFYLDPVSFAPMKRVVVVVPLEANRDEKSLPLQEYEHLVGKRFLDAIVDYQNQRANEIYCRLSVQVMGCD